MLSQLATGPWSDAVGRKPMIVWGLALQAGAILAFASGSETVWWSAAVAMGFGTAMAYPSLLAAVGDAADPAWRASAVGVYRLWRDAGYVGGAILSGLVADAFGTGAAIVAVAAVTAFGAAAVGLRMRETLRRHERVG
jgi:MFS family permease